ncbi:MAG: YgeY family selenium metabolism-linked hydrolase [Desulfovibrionaceae bacterium]
MRTHYTDKAVALCQALVACPSVSGQEGAVAATLAKAMRDMGFDSAGTDRYGNVVGVIQGGEPGPCVLLDGHIDTVPVPDATVWTHAPFGGDIVDGRIYGRGASDMKGAVACMAAAAAWFAASSNRRFKGSVRVAGGVHEECFEGIAARAISAAHKPDYVVIGEASELNLKIAQRGRAEIVVETIGRPAHSASPEKGVNAVLMMQKLIERIERITPPEHPMLGKGICVLTDIKSTPYPGASVVPSGCRATYDRRLLVGETPEDVLRPFKQAIAELNAGLADFHATVSFARGREACYTGETIEGERFFPGWLHSEDEPFVQSVLAGLRGAGLAPAISHYAFCTNGSHYAGEAGIPTLGFGPSLEHLAHTIDEYIEVEQVALGVLGYHAILGALLPS